MPGILEVLLEHQYIFQTLITSGIIGLTVLGLIGLFSVKQAALKACFFLLPLVLPFLLPAVFFFTDLSHTQSQALNHLEAAPLDGLYSLLASLLDHRDLSFMLDIFLSICFLPVVVASGKLTLRYWACRRILRRCRRLNAAEEERLRPLLDELRWSLNIKNPRCLVTPDPHPQAFVFGVLAPVIGLSRGALEKLPDHDLRTAILHEAAHIVRRDTLIIWLALFLKDLMFYNPIAHYFFNRLVIEKEKACDQLVADITRQPAAYARNLLNIYKTATKAKAPEFSYHGAQPLLLSSGYALEDRIRFLVSYSVNPRGLHHRDYLLAGGMAIFSLVTIFLSTFLPVFFITGHC